MASNNVMTKVSRNLWRGIGRTSPTILAVLAVAGGGLSIYMTVKATTKALKIIEAEEQIRQEDQDDPKYGKELEPMEIVGMTWKLYAPTAAMFVLTTICIIGSNSINMRRNAALAGLLSMMEGYFYDYQQSVIDEFGEKKEKKVSARASQKVLDRNPITEKTKIYNGIGSTGKGPWLVCDRLTGRYFWSDAESIRRVVNQFNRVLKDKYVLTLNDFYEALELEPDDIGASNGWYYDKALVDVYFDVLKTPDDIPCLVLIHKNIPINIWG